jgi:hypothetical protein
VAYDGYREDQSPAMTPTMKVYVRSAHFTQQMDHATHAHECLFRYRFLVSPEQDRDEVWALVRRETEQVLRRAFGDDVEFVMVAPCEDKILVMP